MDDVCALILAAGKGTRMKSDVAKVLHETAGRTMIGHVLAAVEEAGFGKVFVVVGHQGEAVRREVGEKGECVWQHEQLGTGHAVLEAGSRIEAAREEKDDFHVMVLYGDTPLVTDELLREVLDKHRTSRAAATLVSVIREDPTGYGRIIRDEEGKFAEIVEETEATPEQAAIKEVNAGLYCFRARPLFSHLPEVESDNEQGEYYLVDVLPLLLDRGGKVEVMRAHDPTLLLGVNDRQDLAEAGRILRRKHMNGLMKKGVSIVDPSATYVDPSVTVQKDVTIYPFTILNGDTEIASGCEIGPSTHLEDVKVGPDTVIKQSVVTNSRIGRGVTIGPFSHIRPETSVHDGAKVGNYAEIKKSQIGESSKVPHHSYVGDSVIGKEVNMGAGVVTVNYDGYEKHETVIEDGAFIGCNVNLIAPVKVRAGGFVAAGSTINRDVPEKALGIARGRQVNKEGWVERRRRLMERRHGSDSISEEAEEDE